MSQEIEYSWIIRRNIRDEKRKCRPYPVLFHPLKSAHATKSESGDKNASVLPDTRYLNRSARSSTSGSTISLTRTDEKSAAIKPIKEHPKFIDPLGATFENSTLIEQESDLFAPNRPKYDPNKAHDSDKIKNTLLGDESRIQRRKKYEFEEYEPWLSKKAEILRKFVTNEKLSIVTSFLPGGVPIHAQATVSEVQLKLEQLDSFNESSIPKRIQNLSQKDYIEKVNELTRALVEAWTDDQRVQAIKIVIQCSKFLADTTSVPKFYPSQFVLVADVLDTFGRLVYERLEQKVFEEEGGSVNPTDRRIDWATVRKIPQSVKEIARNWFYKVASVRELLPRFYVEVSLLPIYRFLDLAEQRRSVNRLAQTCRGLADPLASCYARCYLLKTAFAVDPSLALGVDAAWRCFHDCLSLLWPPAISAQDRLRAGSGTGIVSLSNGPVVNDESKNESNRFGAGSGDDRSGAGSGSADIESRTGFDDKICEIRELLAPAVELVVDCLIRGSTQQDRSVLLSCCEQKRDPMLAYCVFRSMRRKHVAENVIDCIRLVKTCYAVDSDRRDENARRVERCRWASDALRLIGDAVCDVEPSPNLLQQALKDAWRIYRRFIQVRTEYYVGCACAWLRFAARHFGAREIAVLLGELSPAIRVDRLFERYYDALIDALKDMARFLTASIGLAALVSMQNFTQFFDLFERADVRASAAEILLNYFITACDGGDDDDPSLTNHFLNFCSAFAQSLDVSSSRDEQRRVASKICRATRRFLSDRGGNDLREDVERQLTFCVEARGRLCRASHAGDLLAAHLSHAVNRAAARLAARESRSPLSNDAHAADDLARSCLAFVYVTAPSVSDYFVRLGLYLEAAYVASLNECASQRDSLLRVVISTLAERPPVHGTEVDTKRHYASTVANVLSLLYFVTTNEDTDRQPLYYFNGLMNAIKKQDWNQDGIAFYAKLLLDCLSFLACFVQSQCDFDDADNQLATTCASVGGELLQELLDCLLALLTERGNKPVPTILAQSQQRRATGGGAFDVASLTPPEMGARLCVDLADLIVERCDLSVAERLADLVASLWTRARKTDASRTSRDRLTRCVARLQKRAATDFNCAKLAERLVSIK